MICQIYWFLTTLTADIEGEDKCARCPLKVRTEAVRSRRDRSPGPASSLQNTGEGTDCQFQARSLANCWDRGSYSSSSTNAHQCRELLKRRKKGIYLIHFHSISQFSLKVAMSVCVLLCFVCPLHRRPEPREPEISC